MEKVLSRKQSELVGVERKLVLVIREALERADGPREDLERLAALVHEMDELFLLVVVGEYNTGKSTFINALLGDEVFEMGDLPTTRVISILRYGSAGAPEPVGEHVRVFRYPLEFLQDLEIVDTPGTNSIERMEEELTRGFVPRADLVLFVTSLLQPLTASELDFLGHIRQWGKKTVFIVNGIDRRNSDEQLARVREYLEREISSRLGGDPPPIYFISARQALRAKVGGGEAVQASVSGGADGAAAAAQPEDALNEYPRLERYVLETLRDKERVRLKLLSPLGVLRRVVEHNLTALAGRQGIVHGDARILASIREQLVGYVGDMTTDSERYLTDIRNVLYEIERRGKNWFDDTIRVRNVGFLRNKDAVENRFRNEVVADGPHRIEEIVHGMVDWMVRNNLKLWNSALAELEAHGERLREQGALAPHAGTEFVYNREELFTRMRNPIENRLQQFDADSEARGIVDAVNTSIAQTFGVEMVAAGLGALVVFVIASKVADVTGILTATLLAVAGLLVLPARRRKLQRDLEANIARLNADLTELLRTNFGEQLGRYEQQLLEVVQPYERFLETERVKLERALAELRRAQGEIADVERRVDEAFPDEAARVG
ncbi:MAG: dynamin family protein [Gemmatimonadetes bacterium]|nr:dynamin family protein [Gemmatimonadota bacterium]